MNKNLTEVFNTYNVNILFTVAALPSRVSLAMPMIQQPPQIQQNALKSPSKGKHTSGKHHVPSPTKGSSNTLEVVEAKSR